MKIKGINWLGIRTKKFKEMDRFLGRILGLAKIYGEKGFAAFDCSDGDRIEIFSDTYPNKEHFTTGPVAGFEVEDIAKARLHLEQSGIEFIGPIEGDNKTGSHWSHFRAPDGNIYELSQSGKRKS